MDLRDISRCAGRFVWFVTLKPVIALPESLPAFFFLCPSWLYPFFSFHPLASPSSAFACFPLVFSHWPPSSTFLSPPPFFKVLYVPGGKYCSYTLNFTELVLLKYASSVLCVHTSLCVKAEQTTLSFTLFDGTITHISALFTVFLCPSYNIFMFLECNNTLCLFFALRTKFMVFLSVASVSTCIL